MGFSIKTLRKYTSHNIIKGGINGQERRHSRKAYHQAETSLRILG